MLESEHVISGVTFVSWWKGANQSRDFWVETQDEFIRIHVVPRKHLFDPSSWKTSLMDLKQQLMSQLEGSRITEHIPCLGEGVVSEKLEDASFRQVDIPHGWNHPWIGRSRFRKIKPDHRDQQAPAPLSSSLDACQRPIAMVNETLGVGGRVGAPWSGDSCNLGGFSASFCSKRMDRSSGTVQVA